MSLRVRTHPNGVTMSAGATMFGGMRSLLFVSVFLSVGFMLYVLVLSLIVAAALSRLSVVHNSAAEYSERVYFALPFVFSRRRGSVPGSASRDAANIRRHRTFENAFPETRHRRNSKRVQCAVCIEPLRPGDRKRRLPCTHEFHAVSAFIASWSTRCPLRQYCFFLLAC